MYLLSLCMLVLACVKTLEGAACARAIAQLDSAEATTPAPPVTLQPAPVFAQSAAVVDLSVVDTAPAIDLPTLDVVTNPPVPASDAPITVPDLIADAAAIVAALPPITLSTEIVSATTPASPPASSTPPTPVTPVVPVPPEASQYTHSLISDFTTQPLDTADWTVEVYNVSADKDQQSPWGRSAAASNVVSTPSGLELWVRSQLVDGGTKVSTSEINSVRRDILYGTFRVGMTIPYVPGSCAAFFYYRDDASEIDLEFLSQDASAGKHPMYFVLHDVKGDQGPAPAPLTPSAEIRSPSFQAVNLATDLTSSVHEYRFDWAPEGISFYFDGVLLASYTDPAAIPSKPGMLAFNHWSNGNKYWTRGPPTQDSKFVITYVHAWFNTAAG